MNTKKETLNSQPHTDETDDFGTGSTAEDFVPMFGAVEESAKKSRLPLMAGFVGGFVLLAGVGAFALVSIIGKPSADQLAQDNTIEEIDRNNTYYISNVADVKVTVPAAAKAAQRNAPSAPAQRVVSGRESRSVQTKPQTKTQAAPQTAPQVGPAIVDPSTSTPVETHTPTPAIVSTGENAVQKAAPVLRNKPFRISGLRDGSPRTTKESLPVRSDLSNQAVADVTGTVLEEGADGRPAPVVPSVDDVSKVKVSADVEKSATTQAVQEK